MSLAASVWMGAAIYGEKGAVTTCSCTWLAFGAPLYTLQQPDLWLRDVLAMIDSIPSNQYGNSG